MNPMCVFAAWSNLQNLPGGDMLTTNNALVSRWVKLPRSQRQRWNLEEKQLADMVNFKTNISTIY